MKQQAVKKDVFQTGANAMANASTRTIQKNDVIEILKTGDGPGHLVRALFEDCSLESLERMAIEAGRTPQQVRNAYRHARQKHGARNPDFEDEDAGF